MTLETAACKYFLLLSKLEYALKNTGFITSHKNYAAKPDWNSFIDRVHGTITIDTQDSDVQNFLNNPPKKQLYKDGNLSWSKPEEIKASNQKEALQACLTVRNNLFHGGKHGDGNAGRNEYLLSAATKILTSAMKACPKVEEKFNLAEL